MPTQAEIDAQIDRIMSMSEAELDAEMRADGLDPEAEVAKMKQIIMDALRKRSPYGEWCRDPLACAGKGYCPRDPNCGD